jgi:two-component system chemotaxis response regulator CheY
VVNQSLQVLVVDDVAVNRLLADTFLTRMGHVVHELDSGVAALSWLAQRLDIDLLLLDINMPGLSGEEVCTQLRANPAHACLKIVAYTAHAGAEDKQRYLSHGFDAVLVKPISIQRLSDTINGLF